MFHRTLENTIVGIIHQRFWEKNKYRVLYIPIFFLTSLMSGYSNNSSGAVRVSIFPATAFLYFYAFRAPPNPLTLIPDTVLLGIQPFTIPAAIQHELTHASVVSNQFRINFTNNLPNETFTDYFHEEAVQHASLYKKGKLYITSFRVSYCRVFSKSWSN